MPVDWLETILASKRLEIAGLKKRRSEWKERIAGLPPARSGRFRQALSAPGLQVIAEIKRASPSRGPLAPDLDVARIAAAYQTGGAAAISVLTEERYFLGSGADLQSAREASGLPVLRKDFLIDPLQIEESRGLQADAVLLIAAALPGQQLGEMIAAAQEAGLDALVETHDAAEIERALTAGAAIVGVNSRDLRTFDVDRSRTARLCRELPSSVVRVAESGIHSREHAQEMRKAGYDAILVGERLVSAKDPAQALQEIQR